MMTDYVLVILDILEIDATNVKMDIMCPISTMEKIHVLVSTKSTVQGYL